MIRAGAEAGCRGGLVLGDKTCGGAMGVGG